MNRFVGLCTEAGNESIIAEYCSKGSLANLLDNDAVNLDETFRFSLMNDIIQVCNASSIVGRSLKWWQKAGFTRVCVTYTRRRSTPTVG